MKYVSDAAPSLPFYYYHIPSMDSITFTMYDFVQAAQTTNFTNLVGIKYTGLYNNPSFEDVMLILHSFDSKIEVLTGRYHSASRLVLLFLYLTDFDRTYKHAAYVYILDSFGYCVFVFVLLCRDEMLIQGLVSGVKGMVGSQYNFAGELYNSIINEWNAKLMNNYPNCTENEGYASLSMLGDLQVAAIKLLQVETSNVSSTTNGAKYLNNLITTCNTGDARYPYLPISDDDKDQIKTGLQSWCQTYSNLVSFCANVD